MTGSDKVILEDVSANLYVRPSDRAPGHSLPLDSSIPPDSNDVPQKVSPASDAAISLEQQPRNILTTSLPPFVLPHPTSRPTVQIGIDPAYLGSSPRRHALFYGSASKEAAVAFGKFYL
jgi:hypothetical protein